MVIYVIYLQIVQNSVIDWTGKRTVIDENANITVTNFRIG